MTASPIPAPRFPGAAALATALWLVLAVAAGATGFLVGLPFPAPQLIILALAAATLAAAIVPSRLRDWIDAVPLRALVAVNATRFIGAAFLVVAAQGQLNPVFANRAGWGDITVAILTVAVVLTWAPPVTTSRRLAYHALNVLGFLDLVVAVGTATAVTLSGATPGVERVLTLPLSLVPTFFVPLLLANHVLIFRRLVRGR